jgi:VanZ family protein
MASARATLAALLIASAYAATDEYHQSFVTGRHASPLDWAIDVAGAATAIIAVRRFARARTLPA